ncbi:MAG TPA: single-stranded-DNA-specific exonuclease RecJ [Methylomusa anaerophila]|uniref:Single-stranded-DNA-specific exonuclease RecJ n=1 Tax=Methylomusa anaerophila TaxID=1930071 RepID=A0A348AP75_9FIRM|nr:single-stranded-DNA-specific exonuclease RecJ [Methylomusa anaerophila]BBB92873.1 single-stranded-DNA-specific exonuclease RecJ [Methylomusa anaerophila]HML87291.1 single-stranded-DNA-specific exonuclease RecJ [Methylomusa anaerophila]
MGRVKKSWRLLPVKDELASKLSQELNISEFIAKALINRGIENYSAAKEFLYAGEDHLSDPLLLKDMETAVKRIVRAIELKEKITVYGDYDVDGITCCAIVCKTFKRLGADIEYYIPDRQNEGYGLNGTALDSLIDTGTKLVITVDCGISATCEVERVRQKLDIIITDHHQPPLRLPPAYAVINPKQSGCTYPEKNLAGVGVAFKLCQALWQHYHGNTHLLLELVDIVALGTIADIVPLTGENRLLVKLGLQQLTKTTNVGLTALINVCGLAGKNIDSGNIGFLIAPRLNAAGRISHANIGVELLITKDAQEAEKLAIMLNDENVARQAIEKDITAKAEEQLKSINIPEAKVLVLAGEEWHPGVIGIVASRLVEKYYRPVIMISVRDGIGKGSCRSIPAFDMYSALSQCQNILIQFGGHHQAAGLTIAASLIGELKEQMSAIASQTLTVDDYIPILNIDSLVPFEEITDAFVEQLACLAPHGYGNPNPVFICEELVLADKRVIGRTGRHLKLLVKKYDKANDVIVWNLGELINDFQCNKNIDVVFYPKYNVWQGEKNIQLLAHDVRISKSASPLSEKPSSHPIDRSLIAKIYLLLKKLCQNSRPIKLSSSFFTNWFQEQCNIIIDLPSVELSLTVLQELNLIKYELRNNLYYVCLQPVPPRKLNLNESATYREYRV